MSDSGGYIGSDRDSFYGLTPRQYHSQVDQLWATLPQEAKGPPYSDTVFDRVERHVASLLAENSRLSAEVERMRGVLEAVEWKGWDGDDSGLCPCCTNPYPSPGPEHAPDCPLGRALGRPECGGQPMETEDEQIRVDDASALACRMQTEGGDIRAAVARREEV